MQGVAGCKALFLEKALDDFMGRSRSYWLCPSSFQNPGLLLAAAAAALCMVLGWVAKEQPVTAGRACLIRKAGQQCRETERRDGPAELGLQGEKTQGSTPPPKLRHCVRALEFEEQ